jgi:hypothetical protein
MTIDEWHEQQQIKQEALEFNERLTYCEACDWTTIHFSEKVEGGVIFTCLSCGMEEKAVEP